MGKSGSAGRASAGQHFSAASGAHSFSKAVLLAALSFFRLVCSYHDENSILFSRSPAFLTILLLARARQKF